ncbi:MAG: diguanylate cyclase [Nitrospinae bacterium]|nr:diguanylate cyclase [Nitrospinota bacterium]
MEHTMNAGSDDLAGMRILLVDDVLQNIDVLYQTLKSKNYELAVVNSGIKTLEVASKFKPDLILLDIMMPGMDGIETCKKLKANESTKDISIIFITAKRETADVVEGFMAGGLDYITKPFFLEEVLARVTTHLKLKKLIRDKDNLISELQDTQEILMKSAKTDLLTGLLSRFGMEEELERSRSQQPDKSFSIILADIDHIGKINEGFGRKTGDQVIIRTADILRENVRDDDRIGRWSSEEFFIFLPKTSIEDAKNLAEKIRLCIEQERLNFNQKEIPLTLSLGVNTCLPETEFDRCFIQAEECLNEAKNLGRNRLVVAESS